MTYPETDSLHLPDRASIETARRSLQVTGDTSGLLSYLDAMMELLQPGEEAFLNFGTSEVNARMKRSLLESLHIIASYAIHDLSFQEDAADLAQQLRVSPQI